MEQLGRDPWLGKSLKRVGLSISGRPSIRVMGDSELRGLSKRFRASYQKVKHAVTGRESLELVAGAVHIRATGAEPLSPAYIALCHQAERCFSEGELLLQTLHGIICDPCEEEIEDLRCLVLDQWRSLTDAICTRDPFIASYFDALITFAGRDPRDGVFVALSKRLGFLNDGGRLVDPLDSNLIRSTEDEQQYGNFLILLDSLRCLREGMNRIAEESGVGERLEEIVRICGTVPEQIDCIHEALQFDDCDTGGSQLFPVDLRGGETTDFSMVLRATAAVAANLRGQCERGSAAVFLVVSPLASRVREQLEDVLAPEIRGKATSQSLWLTETIPLHLDENERRVSVALQFPVAERRKLRRLLEKLYGLFARIETLAGGAPPAAVLPPKRTQGLQQLLVGDEARGIRALVKALQEAGVNVATPLEGLVDALKQRAGDDGDDEPDDKGGGGGKYRRTPTDGVPPEDQADIAEDDENSTSE